MNQGQHHRDSAFSTNTNSAAGSSTKLHECSTTPPLAGEDELLSLEKRCEEKVNRFIGKIRKKCPQLYHEFSKLVGSRSFGSNRLTEKVKKLFQGQPDLISEFEAFMGSSPDDNFEIKPVESSLDGAQPIYLLPPLKHPKRFLDKYAVDIPYLNKIKRRFKNRPQVYDDFLSVVYVYSVRCTGTKAVMEVLSKLFEGHNDLIMGFNTYLPPGYQFVIEDNILVKKISKAHPCFLKQHFERLRAKDTDLYLDVIRETFKSQPQVFKDFLDVVDEYYSKRSCLKEHAPYVRKRVSKLFEGYPEFLWHFNKYLPPGCKIAMKNRSICLQPASQIKQIDSAS